MDQRARMVKTLVCLVTAMTGTSALLSRLESSHAGNRHTGSRDEIIYLAGRAVTQDAGVQPRRVFPKYVGAGALPITAPYTVNADSTSRPISRSATSEWSVAAAAPEPRDRVTSARKQQPSTAHETEWPSTLTPPPLALSALAFEP